MREGTRIYALGLFCEFLIQENDLQMVKRKKKRQEAFRWAGVPLAVNTAEYYPLECSLIQTPSDKRVCQVFEE